MGPVTHVWKQHGARCAVRSAVSSQESNRDIPWHWYPTDLKATGHAKMELRGGFDLERDGAAGDILDMPWPKQ